MAKKTKKTDDATTEKEKKSGPRPPVESVIDPEDPRSWGGERGDDHR